MDDPNFARELLLSLPPMESREWASTQNDLKKLTIYGDDSMKERNEKMCVASEQHNKEATSPLSKALRSSLDEHQQHYKDKHAVTARYIVQEAEEGNILIRTCAENLASHNCSAGNWTANWTLKAAPDCTNGELSGSVGLHVFYYEDGSNVQLRANRDFSSTPVTGSDQSEFARAIVAQIAMWETEVFNELSSLFDDGELDSKLRQIRRILPITKTRFKWDAAAQAAVKLLNARSK